MIGKNVHCEQDSLEASHIHKALKGELFFSAYQKDFEHIFTYKNLGMMFTEIDLLQANLCKQIINNNWNHQLPWRYKSTFNLKFNGNGMLLQVCSEWFRVSVLNHVKTQIWSFRLIQPSSWHTAKVSLNYKLTFFSAFACCFKQQHNHHCLPWIFLLAQYFPNELFQEWVSA